MRIFNLCGIAAACVAIASCSGPKGWSVEGKISDPATEKVALEAYNNGLWYNIDSLSVDKNGRFSYSAPEPAHYADIYRLSTPGGTIYFPIDSCDKVFVEAAGAHFGTGYRLSGTDMARTVASVDSTIAAGSADVDALRRALVEYITADTTGLVSYYVVGKAVGGKPLFDPNESFGNRVYGAVAHKFSLVAPDDPRANAVTAAYFAGRKSLGRLPEGPQTVLEVEETGYIDIENYDDRGVKHSISDLVAEGKVVVLSFTAYTADNSVVYNAILNDMYNKYKDRGVEIFQIAFDDNEQDWKTVARNLPWITVWNSPADGVTALAQYNVGSLPVTFIINRKGEIVARVSDPDKISAEVAKYL